MSRLHEGKMDSSPSFINTKVNGQHVSIEELAQYALLSENDAMIVAGSLVEGIGNHFSDIDVIVFCDNLPKVAQFQSAGITPWSVGFGHAGFQSQNSLIGSEIFKTQHQQVQVKNTYNQLNDWGTRCDVEYVTHDEISKILKAIDQSYGKSTTIFGRMDIGLDENELKLFHRLLTGIVYAGHERINALKKSAQFLKKKFCYLLYRTKNAVFSEFQDIVGPAIENNQQMTIYLAKNYLWSQMQGISHLCGNTNPSSKWVPTYSERFMSDHENILSGFNHLQRCEVRNDKECFIEFVSNILNLSDNIFRETIGILTNSEHHASLLTFKKIFRETLMKEANVNPTWLLGIDFASRLVIRNFSPSIDFIDKNKYLSKNSLSREHLLEKMN